MPEYDALPIPCTIQNADTEATIEEIRRLQDTPNANFNIQIHAVLTPEQIQGIAQRGNSLTQLPTEVSHQEINLSLGVMAHILNAEEATVRYEPRVTTTMPRHVRRELEAITWQHFLKPGVPESATILVANPGLDAPALTSIIEHQAITINDLFQTDLNRHDTP